MCAKLFAASLGMKGVVIERNFIVAMKALTSNGSSGLSRDLIWILSWRGEVSGRVNDWKGDLFFFADYIS